MNTILTAAYIEEIRLAVCVRHTRKELAIIFLRGTGKLIPRGVNLRDYVSRWHAHQQVINNGASPSRFWKTINGL